MNLFGYLLDPAHWTGPQGIPARLVEHLGYTALTLVIALVIAVPLGAWIGHTGRGGFLAVGLANGLRALPTLGLLVLLVGATGLGLIGPIVALVILGRPADPRRHLRRACATSTPPSSTPLAAWACADARCCSASSCPTRCR